MSEENVKGERIAKVIARAGLCSRREAEQWILDGVVKVDGATITSPALNVLPHQAIKVRGKLLPQADRTRMWLFHKPRGAIVSRRDPEGRQTIYDMLPPELQQAVYVGRLDYLSEGLLLLTNDGNLSRYLELPATGWIRHYRARVFGEPSEDVLARLTRGVTVEGIRYAPIHAEIEQSTASNCWLSVKLAEGKNREVRRVLEHVGHSVSRLIRVAYGPFQLGSLPRGELKEVPQKALQSMLGQRVALRGEK